MKDIYLYIVMVVMAGLMLISIFEIHRSEERLLVDGMTVEEDDRFIRQDNFTGVQEKNIIFIEGSFK